MIGDANCIVTVFLVKCHYLCGSELSATVEEIDKQWYLTLNISDINECTPVTTDRLGTPRITEERYETPDGEPIDFTLDYLGNRRVGTVKPGPIADVHVGEQKILVWS